MGSISQENVKIILNEESSFDDIKSSIDKLYESFSQITNISGKMERPEPGTTLTSGLVLSTRTSAGSILDYVKTTKFLRAINCAIDYQLRELKKEKVKIVYVASGPFASMILPLLPLFNSHQIAITIIDFNQASIDSVKSLISYYSFDDFFEELIAEDPMNYQNSENNVYDLIIIDTLQKGLSVEPQVALTDHFSQFLAEDGKLIPKEIKISAVLADLHSELSFSQSRWSNFWLNVRRKNAFNNRIILKDIFILDKNIREKYDTMNLSNDQIIMPEITVPDNIKRMRNLILLTEITIYDKIILSEEDSTGLTGLYFDKDLLPSKTGMKLKFAYQLGSQPRILVEQIGP